MTKLFEKLVLEPKGPPRDELIKYLFDLVVMVLPKENTLHRVFRESFSELYDLAFRRGVLVGDAEAREVANAIDKFALEQTRLSGVARRKLANLTNKLRRSR